MSSEIFSDPPRDYAPMTWWHWINGHVTREGIKKDLEAFSNAGLRGVQLLNTHMYMPEGPVRYGSEEWTGLVEYSVRLCDSLGLKFCMLPSAGWSGCGGPQITPDRAMKKLCWSELDADGGTLSVKLPLPESRDGYYRDIAVLAVPSGFEAGNIRDLDQKILMGNRGQIKSDYSSVNDSLAVPADSVIVLSGKLGEDGILNCVLPGGRWTILRFGYTLTGKQIHPAAWGGEGYEVDKLDAGHVAFCFDSFMKPLLDRLKPYTGNAFEGILLDSYEAQWQNWSENLPEKFAEMKGYDIIKYLPAFTGRPVSSIMETEQVLYDFRNLLDSLISESYYGTMQRKAAEYGLIVYAEAQGGPVPAEALNHTDIPMAEFWNPDASPRMKNIRLTSSLAEIRGKTVVAAEAFSSKPEDGKWQNSPMTLKKPGDMAFSGGINRFVFHTSAHQPVDYAPGFSLGRYGTMFGRLSTWWPYAGDWIRYLTRCQYILQKGEKVADVCLLFNYDIRYVFPDSYVHIPEGYDYRVAYPEDLENARVENGRLVFPSGVESRVLVILPSNNMDMATLEKIREFVADGLPVLGDRPETVPSLQEAKHTDECMYASLVSSLWSEDLAPLGDKVCSGHSLEEVMNAIGLEKDVDFSGTGNLSYIHKKTGRDDVYFISNQSGYPVEFMASFRIGGRRRCLLMDAVSGNIQSAKANDENGVKCVNISLDGYESVFVVFGKGYGGYADEAAKPVKTCRIGIPGPWYLSFADSTQCRKAITIDSLMLTNSFTDPEVRYYSGTMSYKTDFTMEVRGGHSYFLELEEIHDICQVFVNGKDCGTIWTRPYCAEIGDYLVNGTNSIEIKVANSWINRIIGDEQFPEDVEYAMDGGKFRTGRMTEVPSWLYTPGHRRQRHTFYIWRHYGAESPLRDSGLTGKAEIVEYKQ